MLMHPHTRVSQFLLFFTTMLMKKKSKYNSAVEEVRGSFTPIISTCDDCHGE